MPEITEIWAFVARDSDGDEGITAFCGPDGRWVPMIGADKDRIKSLEPIARDLAFKHDHKIRLIKFTGREEIKTIEP
jgi:hypothetical protein